MTAFFTFIMALPSMIKALQSLITWLNKVSGNDISGFILKASVVFNNLAQAKTKDEYEKSAKDLSDLISSMPAK